MQADLGIGLTTASWVVSAIAVVGALAGTVIGVAGDQIRACRMALGGLLLQAAAGAASALAQGPALLLSMRVVEGMGFLAVIVAAPSLIAACVPPRRRGLAFAAWAAFMPAGLTLAMLAAPALAIAGWQGVRVAIGALLAAHACLFAAWVRHPAIGPRPRRRVGEDVRYVFAARAPGS